MLDLLQRRLSATIGYIASLALTGTLLLLCAYAQPGAPVQLWLLFGAIATATGGVLAGTGGALLSAVATLAAVDHFALARGAGFALPRTPAEGVSLAAFIATAGVTALLA